MRNNLPVTQREFPFPTGRTLVSTTDLQGRITYCNAAFIEVSGYAKEELIGQPHNLIRHPDMPSEAFRDMWAAISSGQPWVAAVKNRRKDGDHYWVQANVTALMADGRPLGYLSVRTEAARTQIEGAERLYATMREEAAAGRRVTCLHGGEVQRDTVAGRLSRLLTPGPVMQLAGGFTLAAIASAVAARWLPDSPLGLAGIAATVAASTGLGAWWMHRSNVAPMQALLISANAMAAGDLTQPMKVGSAGVVGRFQRALNQLNVNLRTIVGDARSEVEGLQATSQEMAQGNHDLSQRTEAQAASLEETASSMEEITGTVRQSADAARSVASFAAQVTGITERSAQAVHQVTETMQGIRESSDRIRDIIQVIDGIAFQTNILALNAAVEAARAGEQGRGFAVVAAEVRSLAQRTSTAAREVKQLIEHSAEKVVTGADQTDAARGTMGEALSAVQRMASLVGEIDVGASEQLTGISQVNDAVSHMDGLTQQNAALVEELAAAATSVRTQAEAVAAAVRIFRVAA